MRGRPLFLIHPKIYRNHSTWILMHKYGITISWSLDDRVFIAQAPELSGCFAHGDTQQEALQEIEQAITLWIETAQEFGDPIPEPKGYAPAGD